MPIPYVTPSKATDIAKKVLKEENYKAGTDIVINQETNTINAPKNAYFSIKTITDFLYEVEYTTKNIDYDYANKYFKSIKIPSTHKPGGCTGIVKDGRILRHLDWYFDEGVEFVIRSQAEYDGDGNIVKHASIGVAGCLYHLTKDVVQSGRYHEKYKLLPFIITDGINDAGLYVQSNVVSPKVFDINPEATEECCIEMIVRHILDYCTSFEDVKNFLNNTHLFGPTGTTYAYHYLIAKDNDWRVIELREDKWFMVGPTGAEGVDFTMPHGVLTNFRVSGRDFTGLQFEGDNVKWDSIEDLGIGVERFDIATTAFTSANKSLEQLRPELMYKRAYRGYDGVADPWRTDFTSYYYQDPEQVWHQLKVMDAINHPTWFRPTMEEEKAHYAARDRKEGYDSVWVTAHSCIYELGSKSFNIIVQENESHVYSFSLYDAACDTEKFIDLANLTSTTVSGWTRYDASTIPNWQTLFSQMNTSYTLWIKLVNNGPDLLCYRCGDASGTTMANAPTFEYSTVQLLTTNVVRKYLIFDIVNNVPYIYWGPNQE